MPSRLPNGISTGPDGALWFTEQLGRIFPPNATAPESQSALIFLEDNGTAGEDRFAVKPLPGSSAPSSCPASLPAGVELGPGYPPAGAADDPGAAFG